MRAIVERPWSIGQAVRELRARWKAFIEREAERRAHVIVSRTLGDLPVTLWGRPLDDMGAEYMRATLPAGLRWDPVRAAPFLETPGLLTGDQRQRLENLTRDLRASRPVAIQYSDLELP